MKINIILTALVALFITQSCMEECGECFTPPEPFVFEIVDKETGENLFTNGTFSSDDIQLKDVSNQSKIFTFIDEDEINLIQINSIGWETNQFHYALSVNDQLIFNLQVDAERKNEDCCSFTEYHSIEITGASFDYDDQTGIYKIQVEV